MAPPLPPPPGKGYVLCVVLGGDVPFLPYAKLAIFSESLCALLTKRELNMAGYWPSSFFAFLLTETQSTSILNAKKELG